MAALSDSSFVLPAPRNDKYDLKCFLPYKIPLVLGVSSESLFSGWLPSFQSHLWKSSKSGHFFSSILKLHMLETNRCPYEDTAPSHLSSACDSERSEKPEVFLPFLK